MTKSKPLPKDLAKRRAVLDKQIAHTEAYRLQTNLGESNNVSGNSSINESRILHQLSRVERSHRRTLWAMGGVAVLALSGLLYVKRDTLKEAVQDKPSSIEVSSQIPLIDTSGNTVTGAVAYELSTTTQTRQLANGAGKALLVQVSIDTSNNYQKSTLGQTPQVCMPKSPEASKKGCTPQTAQNVCVSQPASSAEVSCLPPGQLSADSLFAKFVSLNGTDNAWICPSEIASIINTIKTNADVFENSEFSSQEITSASTLHDTAYAPYTQVPIPALRNSIILVAGDIQLVCKGN